MGDVVNLRRARKAKARADRDKTAAANRLAYGRSKAETVAATLEEARRTALLDGALRQPLHPEPSPPQASPKPDAP